MVAKRLLLYSFGALVVFGLTTFLFLESIINTPLVKSRIVALIEKQVGTPVDPAQLTFFLTPQPGIQVEQLVLPLTRDIGLYIDSVRLDLDMRALFKKKIWISHVSLKEVQIRTASGEDKTGVTFHTPLDFRFPGQQMEHMFALLPDSENQMQVILENTATPQFSSLTGSLWISKTDQTLQFDTQIQDLHVTKAWLSRFFSAPDFRMDQLMSEEARLHVRMNPETGISGKLRLAQFEITSSRLARTPVRGSGMQMRFSYLPDQVSFHVDPVPLEYPFAQVSMAFSNNLALRETALTFQGSRIDIDQARDVTLALAPENPVVQHLFDILREGVASEVNVGFRAASWDTLFDPRQLTLEGTAQNALVKIPNTPLLVSDVSGKAGVSDGRLTILAEKGSIDQTEMYRGLLDIELLHPSHVPFTGEFDLDVDLAEVPEILTRLLPDTLLANEMARVTDLEGHADARLMLAVKDDDPDLLVSVTTEPFSATGFYDRIPFPLAVSQAVFSYEKDQIRITGLSADIGKTRVSGGTAQVTMAETPYLDLSVKGLEIDVQELWPALCEWKPSIIRLWPAKQMSGQLMIDGLRYKGALFDLAQGAFDFTGTGRNIRIGFSSRTNEIHDLKGAFDVSDNRVSVTDLSARITDLDGLSAWIPSAYTAGITPPFQLEAGSVQLQDRQLSVSGQAVLAKNVRLSIQLTGNGLDHLKPDIIQFVHKPLTDAMIFFDRRPETTRVLFEGRLDTRTLETVLDKQSLIYQGLMSLTRGQPVEIFTDEASNLHIRTRWMQLEPLIFLLSDPFASVSSPGFVFPQNSLQLHADRMGYKTFEFSDIDARLTRDRNQTDVQLRSADFCGVEVSGRMEIDLSSPGMHTETTMKVTASKQENIATLISCFYPGTDLMEGEYSLNADLTGNGSVRTLSSDLTGEISFVSENGRIHKMTLLSRLLSVLNILKLPDIRQEGFKYHRIEVNAHMQNRVIHLEKAIIDAENMALLFTGEIHPFENRLNLTCLVAPFKTIDTIVQFIPVVNTILEGRLVSFPAKATGAIDDPVITPLHPSAVGEGLINMFTGLLKSPARLMEKIP
ncbi:MAG: AsmA-like C-terminal domain-containing protein [Desulfotignum sp.]|nr:AsmA-like C-terminal domain-containing protein [Desulfotignum sp.]